MDTHPTLTGASNGMPPGALPDGVHRNASHAGSFVTIQRLYSCSVSWAAGLALRFAAHDVLPGKKKK